MDSLAHDGSAPKAATEITVVSSTETYRRLAKTLPGPDDAVLEIGCSTGGATRCLAKTGARVVAVDHAFEFVERLRAEMTGQGNVHVACLDGRDLAPIMDLMPSPTLLFMDIGGNARLENVALQLRLCLQAFRPRRLIVRSFELATLADMIGEVEAPPTRVSLPLGAAPFGDGAFRHLLDLSRSSVVKCRIFAAHQLRKHDSAVVRQRLKEMCDDPHPRVRREAECALLVMDRDGGK